MERKSLDRVIYYIQVDNILIKKEIVCLSQNKKKTTTKPLMISTQLHVFFFKLVSAHSERLNSLIQDLY